MAQKSMQDLFNEELEDLYDAEKQIVKALPKVAEAVASEELRDALEEHLEQTKQHVTRLEQVFQSIGREAKAKKCEGMKGLLEEGENVISELDKSPVRDAALIAAAQKVEHYEISGYGTLRTFAQLLGHDQAVELLEETLEEEKEADENSRTLQNPRSTSKQRMGKRAKKWKAKKKPPAADLAGVDLPRKPVNRVAEIRQLRARRPRKRPQRRALRATEVQEGKRFARVGRACSASTES